ncbi:hypothetical protein [Sulfurospirillum sp. 1612]|uniref:hypothetical protein n=1 Tax=Sulfurospirillum sp. 1612 TaxID=3094835 RepID=UPI002F93C68F
MKTLISLLLCTTLMFAAGNIKEKKDINATAQQRNSIEKIIILPLYPIIYIAGVGATLLNLTGAIISYPIRILIKEMKK